MLLPHSKLKQRVREGPLRMAFVGGMTTLKIEFQQKCFLSTARKAKENSRKKIKSRTRRAKEKARKTRSETVEEYKM